MKFLVSMVACLLVSGLVWAKTEEIQLTTYYPAPYGDFESIRTNEMEYLGVLRGPVEAGGEIEKGVTGIDDLKRGDVYRGFRILGEFLEPYRSDDLAALPLVDFAYYESDKILFNNGGGIFYQDARNGIFLDRATNYSVMRSRAEIVLQPGYTGSPTDYDFVVHNSTDHTVISEGKMFIKGDFEVRTPGGERLLIVSAQGGNNNSPVILMRSNVLIEGDLTVTGTITGNISGSNVTIDNLRVKRQLLVQSDAEFNTNGHVVDADASHLIVRGYLWSDHIRSTLGNMFEVRVRNNRAIGRFRRGNGRSGFVALTIPGEAQGRHFAGNPYV